MKDLAQIEDFKKFVQIRGSKAITTSEDVSRAFSKRHSDVLRSIQSLIKNSPEYFAERNFAFCFKNNNLQNGKPQPYVEMTKDGFVLLVMGFTGKKANKFKIAYIEAFNYMQEELRKGGVNLLEQYYQTLSEHKVEKQFASLCGKGLKEWKDKKPVIEATLKLFEDKIQVELPLI